jgi:large subunit ribosomal protein L27
LNLLGYYLWLIMGKFYDKIVRLIREYMAHTKAGGSTRLGRESQSKRLGVKKFGDQLVKTGNIIIRQRGSKWVAGENTRVGGDDTIYAATAGHIKFKQKALRKFTGKKAPKTIVSVVPNK